MVVPPFRSCLKFDFNLKHLNFKSLNVSFYKIQQTATGGLQWVKAQNKV